MRITAVRAAPANIPPEAPYKWLVRIYPGTSKTAIEIDISEEITGLGESGTWALTVLNNQSSAALKRCHERFRDEGPYDQHFDPANPDRKIVVTVASL